MIEPTRFEIPLRAGLPDVQIRLCKGAVNLTSWIDCVEFAEGNQHAGYAVEIDLSPLPVEPDFYRYRSVSANYLDRDYIRKDPPPPVDLQPALDAISELYALTDANNSAASADRNAKLTTILQAIANAAPEIDFTEVLAQIEAGSYTDDDRTRDAQVHNFIFAASDGGETPIIIVPAPTDETLGCAAIVTDATGKVLPNALVKLLMDTPGDGTRAGRWRTSSASERTDALGALRISLIKGASYWVLSPSGQIIEETRFTVPTTGDRFDLPELKIR